MDDWEYNNTEDDYWSDTGNEANPDTYNDYPAEDNYWSDTGNQPAQDTPIYDDNAGDYTGYTPGGNNANIATNAPVGGTPEAVVTPPWYSSFLGSATPNTGGGITQMLGSIFGGGNLATLLRGSAAVAEGSQNKEKAAALTSIANNTTPTGSIDPWSSQRPFYQQQAQTAVTDPYSSPIVAAQIAQLQKAQNIKDAAAGRRSNSLQGSTAVMSEAAKIAQNYQAQMAQQGGSQVTPNSNVQAQLLSQAAQSGTQGYLSPIMNALGYNSQTSNNDATLQQLLAAMNKMKAA